MSVIQSAIRHEFFSDKEYRIPDFGFEKVDNGVDDVESSNKYLIDLTDETKMLEVGKKIQSKNIIIKLVHLFLVLFAESSIPVIAKSAKKELSDYAIEVLTRTFLFPSKNHPVNLTIYRIEGQMTGFSVEYIDADSEFDTP